MEEERTTKNGNGLAINMGICGFESQFVKCKQSPLGETYCFALCDFSQFNERKLIEAIDKISNRLKIDFQFVRTKELGCDYGVLAPYKNSNALSLTQCISEVQCREIVVGKDSDNNNVSIDFDKIPHLLIAGTTGSGKSVLLHNFICNIAISKKENLFKRKGLVVIDTKNSDLSRYAEIPNVVHIVEVSQAIEELKEVEREMDKRYQDKTYPFDLFVVIDELADLMLTSRFEVERSLVRIAQLGRACGIHLIVATQRPTCDVVSGLIKANMPYRFALKCASVRDSVIILDHKGAERLEVGQAIFKNGLHETHLKIAYPSDLLISKIIEVSRG